MTTRRRLLQFTAFTLPVMALAACDGNAQTAATVAITAFKTYAQEVFNGISAFTSAASLSTLLSTAQVSQITADVQVAQGYLNQITGAVTSVVPLLTAQSWVSGVTTAANSVIGLLETDFPNALPADVQERIAAIQTMIPIVLAAVELSVIAGPQTSMTQQQAEALLSKPTM
jgi:hypothetical protein